jgi:glyoxylase-like metal-dependent hydrolase (beta-lactamase superfamily II)
MAAGPAFVGRPQAPCRGGGRLRAVVAAGSERVAILRGPLRGLLRTRAFIFSQARKRETGNPRRCGVLDLRLFAGDDTTGNPSEGVNLIRNRSKQADITRHLIVVGLLQEEARRQHPAAWQGVLSSNKISPPNNEPRRIVMRYALMISAALLVAAGPGQPALAQTGPLDLIKQAIEAQGGAMELGSIKTISAKGDAKHWEPGQSNSVNGESRFLGDSTVSLTADLTTGAVREDWDRDMKYPAVEKQKYSEILLADYGATVDDKGEIRPMSGIRHAAERRELVRVSPRLLAGALAKPESVAAIADQELGHQSYPSVVITVGPNKFIVLFDKATKLPVAVRTRDEDNIWGDSNYDLVFSDWKEVGGTKIASTLSFRLNAMEVQRITFKEITANAPVDPKAFAVPDAVKAAAKTASGPVPYQWVLRRIFLGRFTDSDAIYFPAGGSFKLVELAPNVQMVQGGGANNLIVNMADGIAVFDAPTDEGQSRWVIDAAKAKYPGKPVKYLVLTHHHMDHTGGMRAFVAEGATVIVPTPDKAYFEQVIKAPHMLEPDSQQKAMKSAMVQEVKDTLALKDANVEINLYNIPNPHVEGFLLIHLPKENILWVTDLISPRGPITRNPQTVAVGEALRKYNITGATIAGGHGTTAKQADITPALAMNN